MNGIIGLLQQHRGGATQDDISDKIRDLVAAVSNEGKGGKLVVTISIKPMGKGDGLEISIESKASPPKETAGAAIFFATPNNDLVRHDPRQQAMDLRDIGPATAHKGVA